MRDRRIISNFGFSSILVGFCMMCLLTFAALGLVTANSDYQLSQKVAQKEAQYYSVQEKAYRQISLIDQNLLELYAACNNRDLYLQKAYNMLYSIGFGEVSVQDNNLIFHFAMELSDNQTLEISLEILYPDNNKSGFYKIKQWQTSTNTDIDTNDTLNLIGND